jgi:hypothetical protein
VDCNDNKLKGIHRLWNTPNVERTQIMLNGIRHKLLSLLIRNFTATPALPNLLSEWGVAELPTSILSHVTGECLQFAFSLERCVYLCHKHHIIHEPKWRNIACYQFSTHKTIQSGRIISFITTIRLITRNPTTVTNFKKIYSLYNKITSPGKIKTEINFLRRQQIF